MPWSFALVNNKLAEISFEYDKNGMPELIGHCYVKKEEYPTKKEKKWILDDTKKYQFSYRKGQYRDRIRKINLKIHNLRIQRTKRWIPLSKFQVP